MFVILAFFDLNEKGDFYFHILVIEYEMKTNWFSYIYVFTHIPSLVQVEEKNTI